MSAAGRPVVAMALVLLVALWLGAVIFFSAAVAPAAFRVLPTRTLAGALVGATLPTLFWSGALVALVALGLAWMQPWSAGRRLVTGAAGAVMLVATVVAQTVVAPRIDRLRAELPSTLESVSPQDPRRAEFGRLHGVSVALLGVAALAAAVVVGAGLAGAGRGE